MDEKMRILTMVEEGKLSAKEAIDLIDALEKTTSEEEFMSYSEDFDSQAFTKQSTTSYEIKMLKIIVDTPDGDKVNVQLPVKIIRQVLKMTGKLPIKNEDLQGIDLDALTTTILECLDNET
ncbi:SHOCT-like domain-containing protein, partial [Clostridioides difficile]|uniref:SHOCT-like domain-containing protein n=1 Tax=Clostridioides difficile TaxID=1496 RepID=UPI003F8D0B11